MSYIHVTTIYSDPTSIRPRTQDNRRVPHDVGVSVVWAVGVSVAWWVLVAPQVAPRPPSDGPVVAPRMAPWSAQIATLPVDSAIEGIGIRHTACGDRIGGIPLSTDHPKHLRASSCPRSVRSTVGDQEVGMQ